jgi:hypothetical protein
VALSWASQVGAQRASVQIDGVRPAPEGEEDLHGELLRPSLSRPALGQDVDRRAVAAVGLGQGIAALSGHGDNESGVAQGAHVRVDQHLGAPTAQAGGGRDDIRHESTPSSVMVSLSE